MNFLRRATIALITGILTIGTVTMMAAPAEAKDTGWPTKTARDTGWPT